MEEKTQGNSCIPSFTQIRKWDPGEQEGQRKNAEAKEEK